MAVGVSGADASGRAVRGGLGTLRHQRWGGRAAVRPTRTVGGGVPETATRREA